MTQPEFSRLIRLDEISLAARGHKVAAKPAERALLAERFDLASLDRLDADIALSREAAGVRARGRVRAAVSQICVVSGEPVPVVLDEPVDVLFTPQAGSPGADDEFEISSAECDVLLLEGEAIDLGELAAETMGLALDPYPRLSDADLAEYRRLLTNENDAAAATEAAQAKPNPFSVLKKP